MAKELTQRRQEPMKPLAVASILLFATSLTQDGFYINREVNPRESVPGIGLLLTGWLGLMASMDDPFSAASAWLANPALLGAWIAMFLSKSRPVALALGLCSLAFSLSFLLHAEVMADEAGNYYKITGYGAGYWLWLGSAVTAATGCLVGMKNSGNRPVSASG